jgi:hypothetical protein
LKCSFPQIPAVFYTLWQQKSVHRSLLFGGFYQWCSFIEGNSTITTRKTVQTR